MGNTPFKMKGSPMQRNFGIGGSPLKETNWTELYNKAKAPGSGATDEQIETLKQKARTQASAASYLKENPTKEGPGLGTVEAFASGEKSRKS